MIDNANKQRVLAGGVVVGDFITTPKPTDQWWKVLEITQERRGICTNVIIFRVVNKGGYERTFTDDPGVGRKWYRWIPRNVDC